MPRAEYAVTNVGRKLYNSRKPDSLYQELKIVVPAWGEILNYLVDGIGDGFDDNNGSGECKWATAEEICAGLRDMIVFSCSFRGQKDEAGHDNCCFNEIREDAIQNIHAVMSLLVARNIVMIRHRLGNASSIIDTDNDVGDRMDAMQISV